MGLSFSPAFMLSASDDCCLGVVDAHAVEEVRIHDPSRTGIGRVPLKIRVFNITFGNNARDAKTIFPCEVEIALIMRRAAENCAGAVVHQDKIRDIDRHVPMRIERMLDRETSVEALLFCRLDIGSSRAALAALLYERLQSRSVGRKFGRQRMIRRNRNKTRSEHRVGPGGENIDPFRRIDEIEGATQAL